VRKSVAQAVYLGRCQTVTIDLSESMMQRKVKLLNSTHSNLFDCATPSELCADNPWSPMALKPPHRLDAQALKDLAQTASPKSCQCALGPCSGWESLTEDRWPAPNLTAAGSLRADTAEGDQASGSEPTFEEFHPQGTRYESALAPIAPQFFPYNRCDVFSCSRCDRLLLRYTEFGGYYVDHRVRALNADLVVDAPLPDEAA
jgi:hypothetical protein